MTTTNGLQSFVADAGDVEAIAALARAGVEPQELTLGEYYAVPTGDGKLVQIDLTGDQWLDQPKRKTGTTTVRDVASFLAYWGKHSDGDSEIYADRHSLSITAVLDANTATGARWGRHRVTLGLQHSESFKAWLGIHGQPLRQVEFAEFIEDHRPDVVEPSAADLLELAQTFQATTKVTFRSGTVLKSGQKQLQYVEETNATAGSKGQLTIPDELGLALKVFEGAEVADEVTARLRYRINDGRLLMIVILDQLSEVVDAAFEGVIHEIGKRVSVPILRGTPLR